jgi:hypothetical protein
LCGKYDQDSFLDVHPTEGVAWIDRNGKIIQKFGTAPTINDATSKYFTALNKSESQ